MIRRESNAFYFVYPSWAKFPFQWEALPEIFRHPMESGFLKDRDPGYWPAIGYVKGDDRFQLIQGPAGNGIIKGTGDFPLRARYLWLAVLGRGADFRWLHGFPTTGFEYVSLLSEKDTAEHSLGLKKHAPTYLPQISMDHVDNCGTTVYMSLAFGTKARDEEMCLRFQMRSQVFGLKCEPMSALEGLPEIAKSLTNPSIYHRWYCFENITDDLGLFLAKSFYLGCAAKYEARTFKFVHLVGSFEGKPKMTPGWREYRKA